MKHLYRRLISATFFSLFSTLIFAQDQVATTSSSNFYPKLGLYLLVGITLALVAFTLTVLFELVSNVLRQRDNEASDQMVAPVEQPIATDQPSWLATMYQRLTEAVPVDREDEVLLDHNYDGIKELDNRLPPWWLGLFYGSIVFAVFYIGYYHVAGKGLSSSEAWEQEIKIAEAEVAKYLSSQAVAVDENSVTLATDQATLDAGEITFNSLCATCHLESGAGLVGPNLTDHYWLHGGDIKDVFRVIKYGVPEKGMISWASQLRPTQMHEVASYILHSLVGTNPPNPKEPQGELFEIEPE